MKIRNDAGSAFLLPFDPVRRSVCAHNRYYHNYFVFNGHLSYITSLMNTGRYFPGGHRVGNVTTCIRRNINGNGQGREDLV